MLFASMMLEIYTILIKQSFYQTKEANIGIFVYLGIIISYEDFILVGSNIFM